MTRGGAPEELHTGRLYLRPWRSTDAASLLPILEANQEHLGSWIPRRVSEPVPVLVLSARLDEFAADFERDREWRYAILSTDSGVILGEISLFPRDAERRVPYADADRAEIGYWLRVDFTGRGIATEAAQVMVDLARALPGIGRVEIRCDARNAPSAAIPKRLGFHLTKPVQDDGMVWFLHLE